MGRSKQAAVENYDGSDEEDSGDMGTWSRVESLKPAGDIWVDPESETAQPSWEVPHGESGESADDKDTSRTELYAAGEVWEELIVYKKSIIKPSDINQGGLGDCWFLSAIAALAEDPKRVRSLFLNNQAHDDGGFRVRFHKSGRAVIVSVDDQLYFNEDEDLFYASIKGDEMWVPLLEKAYAKLHGSYGALSGGWPEEAMEDLTGCPGKSYQVADFDGDLWRSILSWHSEGYLLCCSTGSLRKKKKAKGIVDMHAYTMLTAQEVHGFKLLHIRNPWGEGEWTGPWSDNSPLWEQYPDIKTELYDVNADDGVFWMAFEDFVKMYETVHVGFVTEVARGRLPAAFDEDTETLSFSLSVTDADTVFVQAHQEDPRMEGSHEDTIALRISIEDAAEEEVFTEESEVGDRSVLVIATDLKPGEYTVYVEAVEGCPEEERRIVVTAHSSEKGVRIEGPFENDDEEDEDEED